MRANIILYLLRRWKDGRCLNHPTVCEIAKQPSYIVFCGVRYELPLDGKRALGEADWASIYSKQENNVMRVSFAVNTFYHIFVSMAILTMSSVLLFCCAELKEKLVELIIRYCDKKKKLLHQYSLEKGETYLKKL